MEEKNLFRIFKRTKVDLKIIDENLSIKPNSMDIIFMFGGILKEDLHSRLLGIWTDTNIFDNPDDVAFRSDFSMEFCSGTYAGNYGNKSCILWCGSNTLYLNGSCKYSDIR